MAVHYIDIPLDGSPKITYDLHQQNDVKVIVSIGDGQPHYSINVFLDLILKGSGGNVNLGSPREVRGKRIMVVIVVQDRLAETNWTSFTARIEQGTESKEFGPYMKEATEHMDTVIFTLKIYAQ